MGISDKRTMGISWLMFTIGPMAPDHNPSRTIKSELREVSMSTNSPKDPIFEHALLQKSQQASWKSLLRQGYNAHTHPHTPLESARNIAVTKCRHFVLIHGTQAPLLLRRSINPYTNTHVCYQDAYSTYKSRKSLKHKSIIIFHRYFEEIWEILKLPHNPHLPSMHGKRIWLDQNTFQNFVSNVYF